MIELSAAHEPALIVIDLTTPGMDVHAITERLRAGAPRKTSVIFGLSPVVSEELRQKCRGAGCADVLPKPLQPTTLFDMLERHLGLTWTYEQRPSQPRAPAPSVKAGASALAPPSAPALSALLDLVTRGLVRKTMAEFSRLEAREPGAALWIAHARSLATSFQWKALQAFLQAGIDAKAGRGAPAQP